MEYLMMFVSHSVVYASTHRHTGVVAPTSLANTQPCSSANRQYYTDCSVYDNTATLFYVS
jgi:hypothetical protein